MAFTLDQVNINGLRATHFEQLMSYLEWREDQGVYYGNKEQFEKRHEDLRTWLQGLIELARDPDNKIPMRLISEKDDGSKVPCSGGLFAPWDTLEENKNDHFANYYAWEKWLHMQDRNDSLENLDMMEKTLLYAIMVDLVKGK